MEIKNHNSIDEQLLEAAKRGDQKAFTSLMEKYKNSIYHLILKIVKTPEDAEDLTIESFAKAFDKLDQYSAEYAFSTWLYKISSNTCIDFLRKKSVAKIPLDNDNRNITDHLNYSTDSTPELDLIKIQRIDKIQQIIQSMDEIFSRVIHLRFIKEYSYEEISNELNIPVATIKVQLYRAKKQLLDKLANEREHF
ncbi:MAG TPA: sigma-70 family RNA polymerase sigma factor [Chitinophagales bacterium]|nr:sigma-70 family RNA polymerase sigma factor [Chitinophagales bacterium]MBP6153819.1 sigma-70 family RNA polymerase sigma factor [Chitinophagales bacterium]HQV77718.1 sigma-70 family RNA polymerase sigma factor [Chitinophagales bacterium]HQW78191.1 sigma-70 family RNA polymerase sigma factor [Chitinophagales bacterium]HRB19018.1 sigma-70 family RNA polymerase sigma factor [Chitinophagales bacterium]